MHDAGLMNMRTNLVATAATTALILGTLVAPAQAASARGHSASTRSVPQGFAGVTMDPWEMKRDRIDVNAEMQRAAAAGVETVRFPIYWFDLQHYENGSFNWTALDEFIGAAARAHMGLMANLLGAPRWAADPRYLDGSTSVTLTIPRDPNEFAAFASAVVSRYKPGGQFWVNNPSLTRPNFRYWQVWNEPDFTRFWPQHLGERQTVKIGRKKVTSSDFRFAPTYLELLRPASAAIRAADPTAKIMLGSMTNLAWESFSRLYKAGGKSLVASGLFDAVGLNIFTSTPANLMTSVSKTRAILKANGDGGAPIALTEYSWSSSKGITFPDMKVSYINVTKAKQASNLTTAFSLLQRNRSALGIDSLYWYSWATPDSGTATTWDYTGLRGYPNGTPTDKPALVAFSKVALAAEGCTAKTFADSCRP